MAQEMLPKGLWRVLDGYDVRSFGTACPGCKRDYQQGERLVVAAAREAKAAEWRVGSIVCSECHRRSFTEEERRAGAEQLLVDVELVATPVALVFNGETARVLDRSAATSG